SLSVIQQCSLSLDSLMAPETTAFPFSCVLSLEPLVKLWKQYGTSEYAGMASFSRRVQEELEQTPALLAPIEDFAVLAEHKEMMKLLMSLVFPPAFWERDYGVAYVPYQFRGFYATPSFATTLMAPDGTFDHHMQVDMPTLAHARILRAYVDIL